ncbi:MAG: hypothetical protein E7L01_07590 [Paenibacillus macerans]|uniref:Uncharacterized protein n=1 Tax=Paenibacillus macerans TaxID=44252 RepID=A0A090ZFG5_PAEMA|nr:hypothetical protein [Paenibacillus macerans]KFN09138.1 hypothetical protein DJ90_2562 [Paenibacillus macerans]MBS5909847.1 hypothetical protein [Paenibacillus macerans]MCY7562545.1 hypothetical protein [Paenibacillus macerans]MDU5950579.1 hypothetical protein [Paenibacillus macerans]MDU7473204.1 hypothetical protein [Paenibacillus macerans]
MNMKPVELQIAVPRTSEAGRVQHDQQHRPLLDQNLLSQQAVKTGEADRQRTAEMDESNRNKNVRREGNGSSGQEQEPERGSGGKPDEPETKPEHLAEHPYKGRHIDFSL